jgi:uncharacterized protein YbjT (DUF2867 family)
LSQKTAIIFGATGLIGSHLLSELINDKNFSEVRMVVRKKIDPPHPKVKIQIISFYDIREVKPIMIGVDVAFCALGSTKKKTSNRAHYSQIDFEMPAYIAFYCYYYKCPQFFMVSAMGADLQIDNFYFNIKQQAEGITKRQKIYSIHYMRPSLLLGIRKEFRLGELIAQILIQPFNFLLPKNWRAIRAKTVAKAMHQLSKLDMAGIHTHYYKDMKKYAKGKL